MKLAQTILGMRFENPLIVSAGKWSWTAEDWRALQAAGAGGITTKSFWDHEHAGNPEPTVVRHDEWTLNAVGLPDKGPAHSESELKTFLPEATVPCIVSIVGMNPEEYANNARRIAPLAPSAIEINLSSPTFLKLRGTFFDVSEAVSIIPTVKNETGDLPIFVKLSPNIPDIGAFASACIDAGAGGITAINTLGTGLAIDLATRTPILSAKRGGISGAGIKPLAVRCIADIHEAIGDRAPIIGVGGVMTGEDAIELMIAGASLVGLASVLLREGPTAFERIRGEMETWSEANGVSDISSLVGSVTMA